MEASILCHLHETNLVLLVSNSHFAVITLRKIRKELATCARKRALKQTCGCLSSLTFNSHKNCFRSALMKNRIIAAVLTKFHIPFSVETETLLNTGVSSFFCRIFIYIQIYVCNSSLFLRN